MIQFRYGVREAPAASAGGASGAVGAIEDSEYSYDEAALVGIKRTLTQYEIDLIEMGGAEPY
jgi:hypothetical protein